MVICPRCGVAVREGKAFCFNCGGAMNAAREDAKEASPEFRDTVIEPPTPTPTPIAQTPSLPMQSRTFAPDGIARTKESNLALASSAPARSGFFGRRVVRVVLLLLLLLVLGFVALVVLTD